MTIPEQYFISFSGDTTPKNAFVLTTNKHLHFLLSILLSSYWVAKSLCAPHKQKRFSLLSCLPHMQYYCEFYYHIFRKSMYSTKPFPSGLLCKGRVLPHSWHPCPLPVGTHWLQGSASTVGIRMTTPNHNSLFPSNFWSSLPCERTANLMLWASALKALFLEEVQQHAGIYSLIYLASSLLAYLHWII